MVSNFQQLQTLEIDHASKELPLQLKKMSMLQTIWIGNINASNCDEFYKTLCLYCPPNMSLHVMRTRHLVSKHSIQFVEISIE